MHIDNLSKNRAILQFKEAWALEKIHGTSQHVHLTKTQIGESVEVIVRFYAGGETHEKFVALWDQEDLKARFLATGFNEIVVYGEGYGGKQQGMSATYGPHLKFVAFDVKHVTTKGEKWLSVPTAEGVCKALGIEFVAYERISTDLTCLDAARDLPSRQAKRNGIQEDKIAEGVVLRPVHEFLMPDGTRVIAKHKRPEFSERKSKADASSDPVKLAVLDNAEKVAEEFVTPMRLNHVVDKFYSERRNVVQNCCPGEEVTVYMGPEDTSDIIQRMLEDIRREGAGEFSCTKEVAKAISIRTAQMYKEWLEQKFRKEQQ